MKEHVHDCTGPDATCPCGYRFEVPPVSFSIEVYVNGREVLSDAFNCQSVATVADALRRAADKLVKLP